MNPNRLYLSPPDIGGAEIELVLEAFQSNWIAPAGPNLDAFEQDFAMLVATGLDGRDIGGLAIQVHKDEGLGGFAGLGFLFDDSTRERGIHVPAAFFGIDEDGLGPEISDGRGGRDEGQRRTQDFVARTDVCKTQREMQGGGAGRDSDGILGADELGEIFFKGVEIWSRRRDPIGLESFQDEFDFSAADIRRREVKARERHWV